MSTKEFFDSFNMPRAPWTLKKRETFDSVLKSIGCRGDPARVFKARWNREIRAKRKDWKNVQVGDQFFVPTLTARDVSQQITLFKGLIVSLEAEHAAVGSGIALMVAGMMKTSYKEVDKLEKQVKELAKAVKSLEERKSRSNSNAAKCAAQKIPTWWDGKLEKCRKRWIKNKKQLPNDIAKLRAELKKASADSKKFKQVHKMLLDMHRAALDEAKAIRNDIESYIQYLNLLENWKNQTC